MPQALARQHMSLRRARAARACRRTLSFAFSFFVVAAGRRPPGIDAGRGAQNCGRDRDGAMTQSSTGRFYAPAAALRDGPRMRFGEQEVCSPKHPRASQGIRLRDENKQHPALQHPLPPYTQCCQLRPSVAGTGSRHFGGQVRGVSTLKFGGSGVNLQS